MIDVHVLIHPTTPVEWVRLCLSSVRLAARNAGFPVDVHELPAVIGHIGMGRAAGYALGKQPYVSCVDDDDYLLPNAFAQMGVALDAGAIAVSTPEILLQNDTFSPGRQRHHLIAYRRESIIDHTQWPCCGDVAQIHAIPDDDWHDPMDAGYVHRVYESRARVMRRSHQSELVKARG